MAYFSGLSNCMKVYKDISLEEYIHLISRISFMIWGMIVLMHLSFIILICNQFDPFIERLVKIIQKAVCLYNNSISYIPAVSLKDSDYLIVVSLKTMKCLAYKYSLIFK